MVTFSQNQQPMQPSPHGDGQYLAHMIARMLQGSPDSVATGGDTVISGSTGGSNSMDAVRALVESNYVDNAPIPAARPAPSAPTAVASPNIPNVPQARPTSPIEQLIAPEPSGRAASFTDLGPASPAQAADSITPGGNSLVDTANRNRQGVRPTSPANDIETLLTTAQGATNDEGGGFDYSSLLGPAGALGAIVLALLSGRGKRAPTVNASGAPNAPGTALDAGALNGEILGPQALPAPSSSRSVPTNQIETDILGVTENTLPAPSRALPAPNQALPAPQGNRTYRYRRQEYTVDDSGNVLDRNGDVVNDSRVRNYILKLAQNG